MPGSDYKIFVSVTIVTVSDYTILTPKNLVMSWMDKKYVRLHVAFRPVTSSSRLTHTYTHTHTHTHTHTLAVARTLTHSLSLTYSLLTEPVVEDR